MKFLERFKKNPAVQAGPAPDVKPGRNDPCWCGSGKKYKRCHYEKDQEALHQKLAAALNCKTRR